MDKTFILRFIAHVQEEQGCGVAKAFQLLQENNSQFKTVSERSIHDWKKKISAIKVAADLKARIDGVDEEFIVEDIVETPSLGRPCMVSLELRDRVKTKVGFLF